MNKKSAPAIPGACKIVFMWFFLLAVGCAATPAKAPGPTTTDSTAESETERVETGFRMSADEIRAGVSGITSPGSETSAGVEEEKPVEIRGPAESPEKPPTKKPGPSKKKTSSGLRAGVSDDNKQFNYYLNFLEKFKQVPHIPMDVGERIVLQIKDLKGKPVPNAEVSIYHGSDKMEAGKTFADGTYLFFPSGFNSTFKIFKTVINYGRDQTAVTFSRESRRKIEIQLQSQRQISPQIPVDIVFILDTTGSMGEEINRLKKTIEIINLNLSSLSSRPKMRYGMVLYRDQRDDYVTSVVPLTTDLDHFSQRLQRVNAYGGGDNPEDLQSALHDALKKIQWNPDGIRIGFVITDAPPHLDYGQEYTYVRAAADARSAGIKLFTIGTGGLNVAGEYVLRQISQYTYAKYIFLTYGESGESEGGKAGSVSHHTGANYQTDKLEAIVIRIAKEEISHLSDQPLAQGEEYFEALKIDDESNDKTLGMLFDRAVSQLVDYAAISIPAKTPAAVLPIGIAKAHLAADAEYFSQQLLLSFSRNRLFKAVERKDLQTIMKELKIQHSGLVKEENAVEVGKMLGAKMIVTGNIIEKESNYIIFLKLVQVETAEILSVTKLLVDKKLGISG